MRLMNNVLQGLIGIRTLQSKVDVVKRFSLAISAEKNKFLSTNRILQEIHQKLRLHSTVIEFTLEKEHYILLGSFRNRNI